MTLLSPKGLRAVEEIAHRTGFSQDAVTSMLVSIVRGRGGMAQFSHPEFGGSGQWMAGGAIMISDMFNNALKVRVDALCNELSALIRSEPDLSLRPLFNRKVRARTGISNVDHQVFWRLRGLTNRIGGPRILAFHRASEHRTKFATPIFPPPGASPSILTGK
jgi:hypothetical protein